jgi:hypothetical protein
MTGPDRAVKRMRRSLKRQKDVDKRGQGLHGDTVLAMVQKVPLTALVFGIPIKHIKLRIVAARTLMGRAVQSGKRPLM